MEYKKGFFLNMDITFLGYRQLYTDNFHLQDAVNMDKYLRNLLTAFAAEIRKLEPYISNVILLQDKNSWRKRKPILPPKFYQQITKPELDVTKYKGNRSKDDKINWENQGIVLDRFAKILTDNGCALIKRDGAEADDSMKVVPTLLGRQGFRSLLWCNDGDIIQCVDEYAALLRVGRQSDRTLYLSPEMVEFYGLGKSDGEYFHGDFTKRLLKEVNEVIHVKGVGSVFTKLFYGDAKDNIPPIYCKQTKNKKGELNIGKSTPTHAVKALKEMGITFVPKDKTGNVPITEEMIYDDSKGGFVERLCSGMLKAAKLDKNPKNMGTTNFGANLPLYRELEDVTELFRANRSLLLLNRREIPKDVSKGISEQLRTTINQTVDFKVLGNTRTLTSGIVEAGSKVDKFLQTKPKTITVPQQQPNLPSALSDLI